MRVEAHEIELPGALEVVSLTTGTNGRIYGGTTGGREHLLFEYTPGTGAVRDLGAKIVPSNQLYARNGDPISQKIHHALDTLADGRIVGGTGQNVGFGSRHRKINEDDGGHVFIYDPATDTGRDLGVPVPHMWIIATTVSPDGSTLFGMTYFHNDFFAMDLESGEVVFADQVHAGVWGDSACSHTIVCDRDGIVYGSCSEGYLFTYDSAAKKLTETDVKLPGEGSSRIDALLAASDGMIYGGMWETGILFSIEPGSLAVTELGQPNDGPRLPALVERDGLLYGAAGGGSQYGTCGAFLFEYGPRSGAYRKIGPIVDEQSGVEAARVHAMTVGADGTLYAGETGATHSRLSSDDGDIEAGMHPYLYVIET